VSLEISKKDLRWYLSLIEEVVIRTLMRWDLVAERSPTDPGVWLDSEGSKKKIAAVGIAASRWVTMHGFALNVDPDLGWFDDIVPCGISDGRGVTSMRRELEQVPRHVRSQVASPLMAEVETEVAEQFS